MNETTLPPIMDRKAPKHPFKVNPQMCQASPRRCLQVEVGLRSSLCCCTISSHSSSSSTITIHINLHSPPSSKLRDSVVKSTPLSFKGHLIMHESFSTCLATARIYSLCELHMSCRIVKRNGGEA